MSLYIAVITYLILIMLLICIRSLYPLLLFGFIVSFMALSVTSLFDSSGTMAITSFTTYMGVSITQTTWIQVLYGALTLTIFGKTIVLSRKKSNNLEE